MNAIELTDSDINLFRLIATTGCCTVAQASKIYNADNKWYHYKRVQRLRTNGYLAKKSTYLELTSKSAEVIGENKYRFRNPDMRETSIELSEIVLAAQLEFISNRTLRTLYNLNRKTFFKGAFPFGGKQYFLYIMSEDAKANYYGQVQAELKLLSVSNIAPHAVIFAPNPKVMAAFGVGTFHQKELFLLPYPTGLNLFVNFFSPLIQEYVKSFIPNGAVISTHPHAHYETVASYYTILILNDLAKRSALDAYYYLGQQKPVTIICLESQQELFSKHYPQAKIIALSDIKIYEKEKLNANN